MKSSWLAYLLALVTASATIALRLGMARWVGDRPFLILFLIPIVLSAYLGGIGPGLVATALTAGASAYFLFPPVRSFGFERPLDLVQWLIFILVGILVSVLSEALHRSRHLADPAGTASGGTKAERKVKAGFALAFFTLLVLGFVSATSVNRLLENASEARKAMLLSSALQDILAVTTDAETGQRGYLLTQNESYLEPYEAALRDMPNRIARLRTLAAGDTLRQQSVEELAGLVEARFAQAQEAIVVLKHQGIEAARSTVLAGRGKELEDSIRRKVKDFEDRERIGLRAREGRVEGSAKRAVTLIAAGSVLACLAVAGGLFLISQDLEVARRSQQALREAQETLEERVRERTRELEQAEALLREAGQLAHVGGWQFNPVTMKGDWTEETARIHDRDPSQPITPSEGLTFYRGESMARIKAAMTAAIAQGTPYDLELELFTGQGRRKWVRTIGNPRVEDGRVVMIRGSFQDITERKRSERRNATPNAVARVLASATSLVEAAPRILQVLADSEGWDFGAIWQFDAPAGLLRCIATWSRGGIADERLDAETRTITFAEGEGLVGEIWRTAQVCFISDIRHDARYLRAQSAGLSNLHSALGFPIFGGESVTGVVDFLARETQEPDEPLREILAAVGRQIGLFLQRRGAEEEVRALNEDLEQRVTRRTEQLEAANRELEAFSYSVSHDLRSPLRAVDGFSLALIEDYGDLLPQEGREFLATIRTETQRMGQLIDDLLSFSHLGRVALVRRAVNMEGLVRTALAELRPLLETRSIEIEVGDLPACEGDPALLQQVWLNLLSNAIKYTSRREIAKVEVWGESDESEHVYHVRDNGAGFDMIYADKLFGVFERLHRAEDYAGTGVGLAIVQRVIQREGGRVWGEGELDRGATFSFTLPRQAQIV